MPRTTMPILGGLKWNLPSIPWGLIEPHEAQARTNHGQSLDRLAERGGLGVAEAVDIIEGKSWVNGRDERAMVQKLHGMVSAWKTKMGDYTDTQRLDFMAEHSAWVAWGRDGEACRLFHRNDEGEPEPMVGWGEGKASDTARQAIDAAMKVTK